MYGWASLDNVGQEKQDMKNTDLVTQLLQSGKQTCLYYTV